MIKKMRNENFHPEITSIVPETALELSDDKRVEVLISVMESIRQSISSWTERSYKVTSWSVGILLSAVSFWILYGDPVNLRVKIVVAIGILGFGSLSQLYLLATVRAFKGNGDTLIKCEAALRLCNKGSYFKEKPFFGYSGKWLSSKSLKILRIFHGVVLVFSFLTILFVSPVNQSKATSSVQKTPIKQTSLSSQATPKSQQIVPVTQQSKASQSWVQSLDLGSWITASATVVLAILTMIYVILTRKILQAQVEPCVIISVIHDEKRPSILQLVIKNIGTGLAHDISFESSRPIPWKAWGISLEEAKATKPMEYGPIIEGIPALGPGEVRKIDWGQYGGLLKSIGEEPIEVKIKFKSHGKYLKTVTCKLDVKSFEGTTANDSDHLKKMSSELKRIADSVNHLASGFKTLKVEVIEKESSEDENLKA